jgi:4-amino-4-deoxy-L-arabinose transferase-like glycosyltransferase
VTFEETRGGRGWRRALFVGAWLTWLACCAIRCFSGAPLGHDEARYAIAGRDLLAGDDSRWTYVPPGMEVLATPGIWAGNDERVFRVLPVLLACGLFAIAAFVARALATGTAGALAIGLLAATTPLVRYASDLLSDVPSAALLLLAAYVIFTELTRDDGPTYRLCIAAPACALAMYVRYGSAIPIAIISALALVGCFRAIVRRPLPVLATALLFVVLMLPHAIHAVATTGSPLGTLQISATVPVGFGQGIATYLRHPFEMLGYPTVAMLPFAIASAWRSRRHALLLVTALAVIVALGIKTFAEPRYVYFSTVLIIVLGAGELARVVESRRVSFVLIGCALAAAWIFQIAVSRHYRPARIKNMHATLLAAQAIRDTSPGRCFVLGRHQTQLEWYSGCTAILVLDPYPGGAVFAVRDTTDGPSQPHLEALPRRHVSVLHVPGVVDVIRLD